MYKKKDDIKKALTMTYILYVLYIILIIYVLIWYFNPQIHISIYFVCILIYLIILIIYGVLNTNANKQYNELSPDKIASDNLINTHKINLGMSITLIIITFLLLSWIFIYNTKKIYIPIKINGKNTQYTCESNRLWGCDDHRHIKTTTGLGTYVNRSREIITISHIKEHLDNNTYKSNHKEFNIIGNVNLDDIIKTLLSK